MAVNLRTIHFRFGKDELAESTHGWLGAEDANINWVTGATFLLRFNEDNLGDTINNVDSQLQAKLNAGAWFDVTTSSTIVKAVAAACFADGANCTARLTAGGGTFEASGAGCSEDGLSGGTANDIGTGYSETEYAIQIVAADVVQGDVISFQLTSPDTTIINNVVPQVTVFEPVAGTTRIYFPSTGAAAKSVTPDAAWNKTAGAQTALACVTSKISSAMANVSNTENVATDYYKVLIQQYVSLPLNGNQAITGTWACYIMGMENNAAADFQLATCARVVSGDGLTVRGTLWAVGVTSSEWNTALRNSGSNTNDVQPVCAIDGDRIVIELGFSSEAQTSTTEYTGTIRIGDNGASDQPENETGVDQALNPWVEFDSVSLSFGSEPVAGAWIPKVIMVM